MDKQAVDRQGGPPLSAFRDHYAAPFVGLSYDLAPHCVGLHPAHVGASPELVGREVLVTRDRGPRRPLHHRPSFRVVLLRDIMRNAVEVGAHGGVVFSSFDFEDPDAAPVLADLRVGEVVYMNAALERLPDYALRRPFLGSDEDAVAS